MRASQARKYSIDKFKNSLEGIQILSKIKEACDKGEFTVIIEYSINRESPSGRALEQMGYQIDTIGNNTTVYWL